MHKREPRNVQEITDRIFELKEQNKTNETDINRLYALLSVAKNRMSETSEPPLGFEYKEAILGVFQESKSPVLRINDVVQEVTRKYHFTPDKLTITSLMNYLADRDKTIERVVGRRGFYQLPPNNQNVRAQNDTGV